MGVKITYQGVDYILPTTGDEDLWGFDTTQYLIALSQSSGFGNLTHVRAKTAAGQSIPQGTPTTVIFDTADYDTLGEYNLSTGIFTAQIAGYYRFSGMTLFERYVLPATNAFLQASLWKNNSTTIVKGLYQQYTGSNQNLAAFLDTTIHLGVGDTIAFQVLSSNSDGTALTLATEDLSCYLAIDRLP